ncbi:aldehyde dehydrogenase (NAD+) [Fusarium phyllophilum]|uniref:Aldehyde dehydrogenase (NAD+) n=1 Tax=Fusarium phyllophilum TaxID=47803 RepID=A0A8H5JLK3_9HYPO|nr:aldehyde dehydrogenase (NAD+) [Fusarium phyllophilum]
MSSELYQQLTAPNGVIYNQPLGLFINNEWRRSKAEELISFVSPIDESEIVKVHAGGEEDIVNGFGSKAGAALTAHMNVDKIAFDGSTATGREPTAVNGKGFFIEPTIFTDALDDMKIYREEIFGPVAIISPFKTEDEAVRRANDTIYGLGAAIFTQDITQAHLIANKIEAGMVWINSGNDSDFRIPFGGVKQSGIGHQMPYRKID